MTSYRKAKNHSTDSFHLSGQNFIDLLLYFDPTRERDNKIFQISQANSSGRLDSYFYLFHHKFFRAILLSPFLLFTTLPRGRPSRVTSTRKMTFARAKSIWQADWDQLNVGEQWKKKKKYVHLGTKYFSWTTPFVFEGSFVCRIRWWSWNKTGVSARINRSRETHRSGILI